MKQVIILNLVALAWAVMLPLLSLVGGYFAAGLYLIFLVMLFLGFVCSRFVPFRFPFKNWSSKKFLYIYVLSILYTAVLYWILLSLIMGSPRCALAEILSQEYSLKCNDGVCVCKVYK